jgi:hypothetical protein
LKAQLGAAIAPLVSGWNGDDIAAFLGTDRSRIAELRRENLDRFSLETIRYATKLSRRVDLTIVEVPLFPNRKRLERKRGSE